MPGDGMMSNIANQLVAVAATLLGFVAHDALTERSAPETVIASAADVSVDPIVTRSLNLEGLSVDWLAASPRAERATQLRPAMRLSPPTAAARTDAYNVEVEFADIHINHVRAAAPGQRTDAFIR